MIRASRLLAELGDVLTADELQKLFSLVGKPSQINLGDVEADHVRNLFVLYKAVIKFGGLGNRSVKYQYNQALFMNSLTIFLRSCRK